ncbi:MAG: SUMF1/EgtB/PvdO family nonheme iron enzyme [Deltaproteobacteria bacterium]|nr:SUMF1/EgtB/PvdO family nonheme iron enzyme [Deltaproteobacteria bacterium]
MGKTAVRVAIVAAFAAVATSHAGLAWSEDELETMRGTAPVSIAPAAAPAAPSGSGSCPANMLEVEGDYCADLPEQRCLKWSSKENAEKKRGRCLEFAPSAPCPSPTIKKHFCIDQYEWPNKAGENPVVMKDWYEARALCTGIGKRLCGESEWTLACEGKERLPYPYGHKRDSAACNIDKAPLNVHEDEWKAAGPRREAEVKRLWQGEPSGSRAQCKSPYGVMDMTGNVDEWVVNEKGKPHRSALKGGYWSWVRGACRPVTDGHEEDFRYYQIGFRCCADPLAPSAGAPAPGSATPSTAAASR